MRKIKILTVLLICCTALNGMAGNSDDWNVDLKMYFRIVDMAGQPLEGVAVSYKYDGMYYPDREWVFARASVRDLFPTKSSGGFANAAIESFRPQVTVAKDQALQIHFRFYKDGWQMVSRTLTLPYDAGAQSKSWNKKTDHWVIEMQPERHHSR
jgi:hypothetical protein